LLLCFFVLSVKRLSAEGIILHLKSGDRITGELVSQNEKEVVIDTPWAKQMVVPRTQLERTEPVAAVPGGGAPVQALAATPPPQAPPPKPPEPPAKPKPRDEWKFSARLGADMIRGEKDRDIYYGQFELTYAHPYEANPKKFFRNKLDYRVDYGTTDGDQSANRMVASDKIDFDVGSSAYAYNYVGGGYDEVRRIDSQIEVGPGMGYHMIKKPAFVANLEGGLTYQYQNREGAMELDSLYARIGQDCTWKVYSKVTLTQRSALLSSLQYSDQMQFRLEANLAFGIVRNLSLNLTAVELYDTRPVPGVTKNEFQLRSALGVTF